MTSFCIILSQPILVITNNDGSCVLTAIFRKLGKEAQEEEKEYPSVQGWGEKNKVETNETNVSSVYRYFAHRARL